MKFVLHIFNSFPYHIFFQNQEMLSSLESTSVRIVKPPRAHCSSAGRTGPSSLAPQAQQLTQAGPALTASSCTPALEATYSPSPDSAGGPRMATIQEDTSSDSHLGEEGPPEDFPTAGVSSSATKSSYEDLTEQSPVGRDRRRLKRQDRIDTRETEC